MAKTTAVHHCLPPDSSRSTLGDLLQAKGLPPISPSSSSTRGQLHYQQFAPQWTGGLPVQASPPPHAGDVFLQQSYSLSPSLNESDLSPQGLFGAEIFRRLGGELAFPLSLQDMKTQFRHLARQHHPDASGMDQAENFHSLQEAYHILRAEFAGAATKKAPSNMEEAA